MDPHTETSTLLDLDISLETYDRARPIGGMERRTPARSSRAGIPKAPKAAKTRARRRMRTLLDGAPGRAEWQVAHVPMDRNFKTGAIGGSPSPHGLSGCD